MTDHRPTPMMHTTEAEAQVLIRFYPGGTTVDLRDGDRWVPAQLIPPASPPEEFDPEEFVNATNDLQDAAAFVCHLADVSRGRAV